MRCSAKEGEAGYMKLLIAEDDPKLLKTLIHIFESNKFSEDGVSNGRPRWHMGGRWSMTD